MRAAASKHCSHARHLLTAHAPPLCRVWDLESGVCVKMLKGHVYEVSSLAVCLDGKTVVSGSDDNSVRCALRNRVRDSESGSR